MRLLYWLAAQPWWVRGLIGAVFGAPTMIMIAETGRALLGRPSLWDHLR
jgi:hypothetical protein